MAGHVQRGARRRRVQVGITAAVGAELVAEGVVERRGVLSPTTPDIYVPALAALEAEGIKVDHREISF